MGRRERARPIVEHVLVQDTFACELARIETVGGSNARLVFTVDKAGLEGETERVIVASIVIPMSAAVLAGQQMQVVNMPHPKIGYGRLPTKDDNGR